MNKLFTTGLLTLAAVPFLMAAPHAAKKTQDAAAPASETKAATKKAHKKHGKKSATSGKPADAAASNKK